MNGDPWALISSIIPSKHCEKKNAKVIAYDHTGMVIARCDCGADYTHDNGAFVPNGSGGSNAK